MVKRRVCKICDRDIIATIKTVGGYSEYGGCPKQMLVSDYGVYFGLHWFCNDCWEIMLSNKRIILEE